jgi:hypothetical protein
MCWTPKAMRPPLYLVSRAFRGFLSKKNLQSSRYTSCRNKDTDSTGKVDFAIEQTEVESHSLAWGISRCCYVYTSDKRTKHGFTNSNKQTTNE